MLAGIITPFRWDIMMSCYEGKNKKADGPDAENDIKEKMPGIVNFLGKKRFLVGNKETWIDIFFLEVLNLIL